MDTEHFIPAELAPEAEGWDPTNPNGFPAKPADKNNVNGVPGQLAHGFKRITHGLP